MTKAIKKKPINDFTPEEKLTQSNKGFVAGRELNTAGEKNFGGPVKKTKVALKKGK